ncbi:tyrosine-type recombinase/integrase [Polluticoccus soli]|uniref:tyrosine-type recombinase/integrase n=1 Tax=Polluticoccus soli TaxID=3034150 RepID=UPI0023E2D6E5|nr:site-specific integrase [Flavipsychrobacter sp. JY13-12]
MATKVTLRQKPISGARQSLYLDFYPAIPNPGNGKPTRREFLGMYIYDKAKTPVDKKHNRETLELAENIRAKRQLEIVKGEYGFLSGTKQKADFVAYFKALAEKRAGTNYDNWFSALNYLVDFTGGQLKFSDLTVDFCNEFKEFLSNVKSKRSHKVNLSVNSTVSYFNKLKAALKQAFKDGYLETDINGKIESIKPEETNRQYLTIEELNKLAKTECTVPVLKQAAIFSALTGLRFSDIEKLVWGEVQHSKDRGYFIQFRQQKTKGVETQPISDQAFELLGERGAKDVKVFTGLKYSAYMNAHLVKWVAKAGVTKDITFHNFRHTYATLLLTKGVEIYTVQKMLGHKHLKTTQVYAKVIDERKQAAANAIKIDL